MLRILCVVGVAILLPGCGRADRDEMVLPEFAGSLPGNTAILMFSLNQDLPQGLIEGMTDNLPTQEALGEFTSLGRRVVYLDLPEAQTGWQSLADSENFRQAMIAAPEDADVLLYLDLQLINANLLHDLRDQMPAPLRHLTEALYLDEFQFLVAGVKSQVDDRYRMAGSIHTGGSGVGVTGLFPGPAKEVSLLAGASSDDRLRIEVQIDPSKAQEILRSFASLGSQDLLAAIMNQAISAMLSVADQALNHLSGRVSIRVDSFRDWGLIAEVSDPDGLMDLLDRTMREESGEAWVLPGDFRVRMRGNLLWAGPLAEQRSIAPSGQRASALFVHVSVDAMNYEFKLMPGVERLDFELERK